MQTIEYITGNEELLDRIEDLWGELNVHHSSVSEHFSEDFLAFTFEARKSLLIERPHKEALRVEVAVCTQSNSDAGYCISSVDSEYNGEIESIYVRSEWRGSGIGRLLMARAVAWLEAKNVRKKSVAVVYGNERAFRLYSEFGFYPRVTVLQEKNENAID